VKRDYGTSFSVIIPARNAEAYLPRCLASVHAAFGEGVECIVVDDGSADRTARMAHAAAVEVISLPCGKGAAAARNAGARAATREILVFLDADCSLHADAGRRLHGVFHNQEVDAVVGTYDARPTAPGTVSRFRNLLHAYTHVSAGPVGRTFWTGCGAVRRKAFIETGEFSENWRYMEDVEFGQRLAQRGGRIRFDPTVQVCHHKRWTLPGMVITDIFRRAAPWTRLILRDGCVPNVLSLRYGQRASVALAMLAVLFSLGALAAPSSLASVLACIGLIGILNRRFYAFVRRVDSFSLMLAAGPLHILYFLSAAAGLVVGCLESCLTSARSRLPRRWRGDTLWGAPRPSQSGSD
jgi:glycosyltransferase involved in cell wall biosynthesis